LRDLLFADEAPPPLQPATTSLPSFAETRGLWRELIAGHAALVVTVMLLTATALVVTLLSPALP
jgi:hypothetical protein